MINEKILVVGRGYGRTAELLRAAIKQAVEYDGIMEEEKIRIVTGKVGRDIEETLRQLHLVNDAPSLSLCLEELDKKRNYDISIPDLKKKIKHSKNPMEKKMLEKQLNGLYKERKRR